jgi:hypothetical protein
MSAPVPTNPRFVYTDPETGRRIIRPRGDVTSEMQQAAGEGGEGARRRGRPPLSQEERERRALERRLQREAEAERSPPSVQDFNHQLLNIYTPLQGLYDIAKRKDDEEQLAKEEKEKYDENKRVNSLRSPFTRIKPLKPSPLDDYANKVKNKEEMQRNATAPNKWVRVLDR